MTRYLINRLFHALIVIWLVVTLAFFMLRAVPGDPFAAMLADVDPEAAEQLKAKWGYDQPAYVQYYKLTGSRTDVGFRPAHLERMCCPFVLVLLAALLAHHVDRA
jgi:ABC-type dipeptide/oligopeptide/nickel transport system permease component